MYISIFALYGLSAILGIVGGLGVINSDVNKVTAMVHFTGLLMVVIYTIGHYSFFNILGIIVTSLVFSLITFIIFVGK